MPLTEGETAPPTNNVNPPLTNGFFAKSLYESIGYSGDEAEKDFGEAFEYMRWAFALSEPPGEGRWATLNVEDIFTSIELDREFRTPESSADGRLIIIRNKLVRYLWRVIALCTEHRHGDYYGRVRSFIANRNDVSLLTFNWDLLLDQEFMSPSGGRWEISVGPYRNFYNVVFDQPGVRTAYRGEEPMYLKMHGSLNWLQCTNRTCPARLGIEILANTQDCLYPAQGIDIGGAVTCERCGTEMDPLLIPPVLRKPIAEDPIIRAVWGQARQRLNRASKAVLIGFSAAPTDFYAAWLLRSTLGVRPTAELEVFVVNPQNDPKHELHDDFTKRMAIIFGHGYNSDFLTFSEIDAILEKVKDV